MAALRCARDKAAAPAALQLAWQAERWGALPEAGGLLDQPAGLMQRMGALMNVYNAYKTMQAHTGKLVQLANTNPQVISLVRQIEKLEVQIYG